MHQLLLLEAPHRLQNFAAAIIKDIVTGYPHIGLNQNHSDQNQKC